MLIMIRPREHQDFALYEKRDNVAQKLKWHNANDITATLELDAEAQLMLVIVIEILAQKELKHVWIGDDSKS